MELGAAHLLLQIHLLVSGRLKLRVGNLAPVTKREGNRRFLQVLSKSSANFALQSNIKNGEQASGLWLQANGGFWPRLQITNLVDRINQ